MLVKLTILFPSFYTSESGSVFGMWIRIHITGFNKSEFNPSVKTGSGSKTYGKKGYGSDSPGENPETGSLFCTRMIFYNSDPSIPESGRGLYLAFVIIFTVLHSHLRKKTGYE